jgi:DNA-binding IscR family transcriptional regulator
MYDVIAAIDGPICLNVCLVAGKSCERKASCPAHPVWAKAQRAMLEVLSAASIEEMAARVSAELAPAPLRDGRIHSGSPVSL